MRLGPALCASAFRRPLLAVVFLAVAPTGYSAALSVANQSVSIGGVVSTPVSFTSGGQSISGIQFDVQWDPTLNLAVVGDVLIGQSSKILRTAPTASNSVRCLIVGLNQSVLADGALVQLFITVSSGSGPGVARVTLANTIATSPNGTAIAIQPSVANIAINSGVISQTLPPQGILNAATSLPSAAAPGEIMTLQGAFSTTLPTVFFNGAYAPVTYAGVSQINTIVPLGLDVTHPAELQVKNQNQVIADVTVPVAPAAPGIFTQSGLGSGPGMVLNEDCTPNTWSNPAFPGSILVVYGTGFGPLGPALVDGQIATQQASTVLPVTATIGGIPAAVTYAGANPGSIAGVFVVNVVVPAISPAPNAPIVLTAGSVATQPGVTVAVQ